MAWVLYLTNGRQVLYRVNRRGVTSVWEGEGSPPAEKPDSWSLSRVAVLVDLMEEEYRLERLPHLRGSDRRALWNRKRRQLFRDEPLVSVTAIGREKEGRRDDQVLFTVLRHSGQVRDWMEALSSWGIVIRGIWSLPRLTAHWREETLVDGMRLLIYRFSGRVALRQNFHIQGRLVFSRLSFVAEDSLEAEGAQELDRTWRYLCRLLGLDPGVGVDLQVWAPSCLKQKIQGLWEGLPFRPCSLEIEKFAAELGLKKGGEATEFPSIAAWKLNRKGFVQAAHYRDSSLYRFESRNWLKLGWYLGSVALLGVAVGYGAVMQQHIIQLDDEVQRLLLQKQEMSKLVQNLPQPGMVAGMEPLQLKGLIDLKKKIKNGLVDPAPLFELVSSALAHYPDFELKVLSWRRSSEDDRDEETENPEKILESSIILTFTLNAPLLPGKVRHVVEQVRTLVTWLEKQPKIVRAGIGETSIPFKDDESVKGEFWGLDKTNRLAIFTLEAEYASSGASQ